MHPYKALADRHFWSRAVSKAFDANDVATLPYPLLKAGQKVMSAGSCFAATLVPYLEQSGFRYVRTNNRHADFQNIAPENFSYDKFSAGYGNIYTARHLLQLTRRCLGKFSPQEDRWHIDGAVVDPFRPGLRYAARSDREFDLLTQQFLQSVRDAFALCDVFIFTLGLTEAWRSKADGAVFPACPGTIAGVFDPTKYEFVNFGVQDVADDLNSFVAEVREINPDLRIILTVSPVPMIATATGHHVLAATSYTKSVLRVAAEQVVRDNEEVFYFPFYEIVTGPQAPKSYFARDRRSVAPEAVKLVMSLFFARCETRGEATSAQKDRSAMATRNPLTELSRLISAVECEEAGQDS
ncbi:MAG TPA: GSCFA domain-containing protein, partial [Chthoniobacterales bacterium]